MRRVLLALIVSLWAVAAQGALRDRFGAIVKEDPGETWSVRSQSGVRITYLGTNGYLFEARDAVILVDPYFSRMSLLRSGLKMRTKAEPARIDRWLAGVPRLDGVLVTHGHIDHLFDVPYILQQRPRAVLHASGMSVWLARGKGVSERQLHAVKPGDNIRIGGAKVRVLRASHDQVFGKVPFEGRPEHFPPTHVHDWTCGQTLAYLIEIGGQRIYLAAGSRRHDRPDPALGRIDLMIQGAATPDATAAWPAILQRVQPRRVLPSHMDNFFRPLDRGFSFLAFTDFRRVRRSVAAAERELILLDYFRPWTLR